MFSTKDWSNYPEFCRLMILLFPGLFVQWLSGIGRVRAGAVVTVRAARRPPPLARRVLTYRCALSAVRAQQCLHIAHWLPRIIEVLKDIELRTPTKMSGTQKYLLAGAQNAVYEASVRAKGISSTFFYVPFLDAVQQIEKSGKAAEQAPDICQQTYDWLMHAATDGGVQDAQTGAWL
jgi:hypothetical protein